MKTIKTFPRHSRIVVSTALLLMTTTSAFASIFMNAENFVLLGGSAITSTSTAGTVVSNGNVGLSPAAETFITGFNPSATITNGSIIATGASTAQARTDFMNASDGLAGMTSDFDMTSVNLGGQVLLPGVYTFSSVAALDGTLTLDANFQNNAFWVFQIGTTFTTATSSAVSVINSGSNGGSDAGIFWNVGSSVDIGASSEILGNYLAGTSITFGNGVFGSARILAQAAISLDNNQIDALGGPSGSGWTGGLQYAGDGVTVVAVPEPAVVSLFIGLSAFGLIFIRRIVAKK